MFGWWKDIIAGSELNLTGVVSCVGSTTSCVTNLHYSVVLVKVFTIGIFLYFSF